MEISISSLIAQIINFGIMFFIFSRFAARPLANKIEERRKLIEKIKKADQLYKEKINEAEQKVHNIISDSMKQKEKIIAEGEALALKQQIEIIKEAHQKSDKIIEDAKNKIKIMEQELEKHFIDSVKSTAKSVVKKLLQKDIEIQNQYLDEIVREAVK